jgi:hypothetical protein
MPPTMIREKLTGSPPVSLTERLRRVVLVELPAWQLLVLAAIVGSLWAASLFDWSFIAGRHAFWRFPQGTITGSQYDMAQVLVAYFYYVQSPWHLPLFYISALGAPVGTNIIFMDVVPVVALAGKLIHSFSGTTINPYGAYLFLCSSLPGVIMTLVLISARTRYALAAIVGAIFANTMPALLWGWGHIALEAHFLLIGALALYLFSLRERPWRGLTAVWIAWLALAYLTNIYLFAMVGIIWLCTTIQRRLDRLTTTRQALGIGVLTVAAVTAVIAIGGQFGAGSDLPFAEYGYYSMNLLAPFMPQQSGLLARLGGVIDATGGQYEGFNYLGLGLLLASVFVLPAEVGWLRRNLRRHVSLLVATAALTALAISHRVFAGHWLLFELPLPLFLNRALGIFRSSGRFFWLIAYVQVAMVVVLGFSRAQPLIALCLAGAAILQLFDVQPLRQQIIASIGAGPGVEELNRDQVVNMVDGTLRMDVVPSFQCSLNEKQKRANMELMLAAARANVPTNTVYLARQRYGLTLRDVLRAPSRAKEMLEARRSEYCEREIEAARQGGPTGGVLVLLADQPGQQEIAPAVTCSPLSWARYCERPKD